MASDSPPLFYYSTETDNCSLGNLSFTPATDNTENGGVCAYTDTATDDRRILWACPARQEQCWTESEPCSNTNQVQCDTGADTAVWCCNAGWSMCRGPVTPNRCWANAWKNPLQDVEPSLARRLASEALAAGETGFLAVLPTSLGQRVASVATQDPRQTTSTPQPTSTASDDNDSSSTASPRTSTVSPTSTASRSGSRDPDATSLNSDPGAPSSSLSGGAIAGIVVAAVVLAILAVLLAFFIRRRRQRRAQTAPLSLRSSDSSSAIIPAAFRVPPSRTGVSTPETPTALPQMTQRNEASPLVNRPQTPLDIGKAAEASASSPPRAGMVRPSYEQDPVSAALEPSPLEMVMKHGVYPRRTG